MHGPSNLGRLMACLAAVCALAIGGCGGGTVVTGAGTIVVTGIAPAAISAAGGGPFTISGGDFAQVVASTAQVTFTATGGATPFAGGTSATATVPATLDAAGDLVGVMPPACVNGGAAVTVGISVLLPSGVVSAPSAVMLTLQGPTVTAFAPTTDLICPGTPFTVTGTGFGAGGLATVTFTAPAMTTPFANGTSNTLVVPGAMVMSDTQIQGMLLDPGVSGPVAATVSVALGCGAPAVGGPGVVANFNVPSVTAFAPVTPILGAGTPVTVTGTGFEPVAGTATITFTAPAPTTPFANGTSSTLTIPNATIDSGTQISGTCPDPMVISATMASVSITLPCGKGATGGPAVQALFGSPGVQGTLQYEFVPHVAYTAGGPATQTSGLDFASTQTRNLAGVRVQVVRTSDQAVLATTESAADGTYTMDLYTTDMVVVRVLAQSLNGADLQVVDNNNLNAIWAMDSSPLMIGSSRPTVDMTATTGWGGASYTGPRLAAPFAVFSTLRAATQSILATVVPQPAFPTLRVKWSPLNNQSAAFWDGSFIMLRGADGVNTDEFDTHVLVHEWGHYFETSFSRSDSPGGQHFLNLSYHPSLAWGEGWATGLAAILLEPDAIYSDTSGPGNGSGFMVDLERRLSPTASTFGWYNEWTVWELVYDLSDTNNEGAWDTLSLGIQGLYNALAGGQANTDAFVSVFSFIDALKTNNPGSAAAIDAMCGQCGMTSPIQDQWGAGEANNGGSAVNLPVYKSLTLNAAATTLTLTRAQSNTLQATQLCRFTGNGAQVTVVADSPAGNADNLPQVFVYANGAWTGIGLGPSPGGSSSAALNTVVGQVYTIWVRHGGNSVGGIYNPTIQVTSP